MALTIADLITKIKTGDYPDVERNKNERITVLNQDLLANYAVILGQCLLNEIPEENADEIYKKRADLFDQIMLLVTTGQYGRTVKLVASIDALAKESIDDTTCWPKRRTATNILQWAADFFDWDDMTKAQFFGYDPEAQHAESEGVEDAEQVLDGNTASEEAVDVVEG